MKISLIGIGMGAKEGLTVLALNAINEADILIGAGRMLEPFSHGKVTYNAYKSGEIAEYIYKQDKDAKIGVLMSGDLGFYSGAKKLIPLLEEKNYKIQLIPGISSVVYLAAKLKVSWQDFSLMSVHKEDCHIICSILREPALFTLLSGKNQLKAILKKLEEYKKTDIKVYIGSRLSYEDELILEGSIGEILKNDDLENIDDLSVALFINDNPLDRSNEMIDDEEFIRGEVPMTKSEIRTLSISKLGLKPDSVLYDVGAGTGSVSIEASFRSFKGTVYAIERNEKGISLIEKNKLRFAADNVEIIRGSAPEALAGLQAPTHCFIGGSAGNMESIINTVWEKNSKAKIVINAIALNTIGEVNRIIKKYNLFSDIAMVSVAKAKKIGDYQMMMASNPVYIFTLERR